MNRHKIVVPCGICGVYFNTILDRKKHDLEHHYDYVLSQCYENRKLLRNWVK